MTSGVEINTEIDRRPYSNILEQEEVGSNNELMMSKNDSTEVNQAQGGWIDEKEGVEPEESLIQSEMREGKSAWRRLEESLLFSVCMVKHLQPEAQMDDVDKYLLELDKVVQDMKEILRRSLTVEEFLKEVSSMLGWKFEQDSWLLEEAEGDHEVSEMMKTWETFRDKVEDVLGTEPSQTSGFLGVIPEGRPHTRSQGPVKDENWILPRALEQGIEEEVCEY